jgi:hypothetical protein
VIFDISLQEYSIYLNSGDIVNIPKTKSFFKKVSPKQPIYGQLVGLNAKKYDRVMGEMDSEKHGQYGTIVHSAGADILVHFDQDCEFTKVTLQKAKVSLLHVPPVLLTNASAVHHGQMISPHFMAKNDNVVQISTQLQAKIKSFDKKTETCKIQMKWNPKILFDVPWTDLMYDLPRNMNPKSVQALQNTQVKEQNTCHCMLFNSTNTSAYIVTCTSDRYVRVVSDKGRVYIGTISTFSIPYGILDLKRQLEEVGYIKEHAIANECIIQNRADDNFKIVVKENRVRIL